MVSLRISLLSVLAIVCTLFTGCETPQNTPPTRPRETSIPWNRPASWEGGGALGGAMGNTGTR